MAKSENVRKMIEKRKAGRAAPAAEPPKPVEVAPPAAEHLSEFAPCRECGKLQEGVVDGACPGCRKVAADLAGETTAAAETFLDSQGEPATDPAPETLAAAVEGETKKKPIKERFRKTLAAAPPAPLIVEHLTAAEAARDLIPDQPSAPTPFEEPGAEIAAEADRVQAPGFTLSDDDRRHLLEVNPERAVLLLRVAEISEHPDNPRILYPRIDELAADVEENGLRDPIKVRPIPDGFQVLSGHRRLRAVKGLGWKEIPATIEHLNDLDAYANTNRT